MLHIFAQVLFWAGNQGNHQNFDPSFQYCILSTQETLTDFHRDEAKKNILLGKKIKMADSQYFLVGSTDVAQHFGFFFLNFFCFIPMKISQSFLGSKDGSKF